MTMANISVANAASSLTEKTSALTNVYETTTTNSPATTLVASADSGIKSIISFPLTSSLQQDSKVATTTATNTTVTNVSRARVRYNCFVSTRIC